MKKRIIASGLIGFVLTFSIGMIIRHHQNPALKLARELEGKKGVAAAMALADLGRRAEPAVPALIKALHSNDEALRLNAALALGKIGRPAVQPLLPLLGSPDTQLRYYALAALGWIGPDAKSALPAVNWLLGHSNPEVRGKALHTLTLIADDPQEAIGPLIRSLGDSDRDVHSVAYEGLLKLGPPAVPTLAAALDTKNQLAPSTMRQLLNEIDPNGQIRRSLTQSPEIPSR